MPGRQNLSGAVTEVKEVGEVREKEKETDREMQREKGEEEEEEKSEVGGVLLFKETGTACPACRV